MGLNWTQEDFDAHMKRMKGKGKAKPKEGVKVPFPKPVVDEKDRYKNKLERAYAQLLDAKMHNGDIIAWEYESLGFRLAGGYFSYPDFLVITKERFEIHEVKGFRRKDWIGKWKVLKDKFPWFHYVVVYKKNNEWIFDNK